MTDEEFLQAFEQCVLPESEWTHGAHVRMAWLYLRDRSPAEALPLVRERIRAYNAACHKAKGYHETITRAYLVLIAARLAADRRDASFVEFRARHPDLVAGDLGALRPYYRRETLLSAAARERFVPPDLTPLPGEKREGPGEQRVQT